jgi:hypothetical protein
MKKYLLAAVIGGMSSLAAATTCQYPLDLKKHLYTQAGIQRFPELPAPYQSLGYTALSTVDQGNILYSAFSDTGAQSIADALETGQPGGDVPLPTSGIVAFEVAIDHFPTVASTEAYQDLAIGFNTSNGMTGLPYPVLGNAIGGGLVFVNSAYNGGPLVVAFAVRRSDGETSDFVGTPVSLPQPVPAGYKGGFYFNMNTRAVGYTINGVDYGYMKNPDGTLFTIPAGVQAGLLLASANMNGFSDTDPTLGMPVGGTLITDSAQFTEPFPAGTTDICNSAGNPGTPTKTLPNGNPFPGAGKSKGLDKFQGLPSGTGPLGQLLKATR